MFFGSMSANERDRLSFCMSDLPGSRFDGWVLERGARGASLRRNARLVLLERHLHFARLASLVGADHALGAHQVQEPAGPRVPDGERALQQRRAAALLTEHDAHGLVVELVLLRGVEQRRLAELHELLVELLRVALAEELHDALDLAVRGVRALRAADRRA